MTTRTRMYVIKLNDSVVYLKHTGVWLPCFGAPCFPLGGCVGCFFVCSLWRVSTLHNGVNGMAGHPKPLAQADSWRLYRDLCELPVIVLLLYRQGKCVFVTPSMDAKQHLNIMCINPIWVFAPNHVFSGSGAHSINGLYRLEKSDFHVSITMSNSSDTDPSSCITLMGISLFFWGPKRFIWFQNYTGSLVFISSISSANFLLYALSAFLKCLSKIPCFILYSSRNLALICVLFGHLRNSF